MEGWSVDVNTNPCLLLVAPFGNPCAANAHRRRACIKSRRGSRHLDQRGRPSQGHISHGAPAALASFSLERALVLVSQVRTTISVDAETLTGLIDGREAWFRFPPGARVAARAEPFLSLALLWAMSRGEDLRFDDSSALDPKLLIELANIQPILVQWIPGLSRVEVSCRQEAVASRDTGVVASFSGGVDSTHTLQVHHREITHLLTINAFDTAAPGETFEHLKAKIEVTAHRLGKTLVPVETNARTLCDELGISWNLAHGPVLCLVGACLGYRRLYVPSSYTYRDLKPWGSHPLLDPLWSTTSTQIVHDGADRSRSEKPEAIATDADLLIQLQVCWHSQVRNCGRCSKCSRTLLVLNALGVQGALSSCPRRGSHQPFEVEDRPRRRIRPRPHRLFHTRTVAWIWRSGWVAACAGAGCGNMDGG